MSTFGFNTDFKAPLDKTGEFFKDGMGYAYPNKIFTPVLK